MATPPVRARLDHLLTTLAGWPRRTLAVLCLVMAGLSALAPGKPVSAAPSRPVIVVTRDLAAGAILRATDLRSVPWSVPNAPPNALRDQSALIGRPIGAPMSRGEPITPSRMLDTAILSSVGPGQVAATVSLPDREQAAILQAGSLINLYATASAGVIADGRPVTAASGGRPVASRVRVLAVLPTDDRTGRAGLIIVIATDPDAAAHLANRPSGPFLVTIVPPS